MNYLSDEKDEFFKDLNYFNVVDFEDQTLYKSDLFAPIEYAPLIDAMTLSEPTRYTDVSSPKNYAMLVKVPTYVPNNITGDDKPR